MPSPPAEPRPARWSLTSRLAWRFALMTSALIALYAAGSMYMLYDALRDDQHTFFVHESGEVVGALEEAGYDPSVMQTVLSEIAIEAHNPPCAYRVRDGEG